MRRLNRGSIRFFIRFLSTAGSRSPFWDSCTATSTSGAIPCTHAGSASMMSSFRKALRRGLSRSSCQSPKKNPKTENGTGREAGKGMGESCPFPAFRLCAVREGNRYSSATGYRPAGVPAAGPGVRRFPAVLCFQFPVQNGKISQYGNLQYRWSHGGMTPVPS